MRYKNMYNIETKKQYPLMNQKIEFVLFMDDLKKGMRLIFDTNLI